MRTSDPDSDARAQALDVHESVLVQAPAGSGKTTVLTCRYLELLTVVDSPAEILAITFTRKAAAQMRQRVLEALAAAARGESRGKPEDPHAARAWRHAMQRGWPITEQPGLLRIQTLDALNLELAGASPLQSGQGFALRITPDPQAAYLRAARQALRTGVHSAALRDAVGLLLQRLDNRWTELERLLAELLARRAHWLPHVVVPDDRELADSVQRSLHELLAQRLRAIATAVGADSIAAGARHALHAARQRRDDTAIVALEQLCRAPPEPDRPADPGVLPAWQALARLALRKDGAPRQTLSVRDGFPPQPAAPKAQALDWLRRVSESPAVVAAMLEASLLPAALLDQATRASLLALWPLLRQAAVELNHEFASQGSADFTAVAAAARASLVEQGGPTDLALRFSHRLRHLLVDEFQDTSVEQIGLLRALTSGWQPGDGRTLFCVGDAMQSIYRFRDAEVGLFLQARSSGIGDLPLRAVALQKNFRSGPGIVEWVNAALGGLFPANDDGLQSAVAYLPSLSARPQIAAEVCIHPQIGRDDVAEAAQIVRVLREARQRVPGCGAAVLVQSREHALAVVPALIAAGFSVRTVRLEPLVERPAVRDLLSLARSLAHPADRPAWLALLRSPLVGLSLVELAQLGAVADATETTLQAACCSGEDAGLGPESAARLRRLCAALTPALQGEERGLPLAQRAFRCWLRLGGPALFDSDNELAEIASLLAGLEAQPAGELATGLALPELMREVRATSIGDPDAIEVLTMHAAKGLEWPVVIVPGLGRRPRGASAPLLSWLEFPTAQGSALLMAPGGGGRYGRSGSLLHYLQRVESLRTRNERLRLLYVAATRAQRELHLFVHATQSAEGSACPDGQSLLATLWPAVRSSFAHCDAVPASARSSSGVVGTVRRLPALWRAHGALQSPVCPSRRGPAPARVAPPYDGGNEVARAVGTLVHEELQWLAGLPLLPAVGRDWERERGLIARLRDAGVSAGASADAARRVSSAITQALADPKGRWLLDSAHRESACELALSGLCDGQWIDVVIDRCFVDAAGTRWVIDYKTAADDGETAPGQSDLPGWVELQLQHHGPQLRRYAALAAMLGPQPVSCALYFPLLGVLREAPELVTGDCMQAP